MGFPGSGLSDEDDDEDASAGPSGHARHRSASDAYPLGALTEGEGATPGASRAATPTGARRPSTAGGAMAGAALKIACPPQQQQQQQQQSQPATPASQQQPPGSATPSASTPGRGGGGGGFGALLTLPDMLVLRERAAGASFSSHSSAGSAAGGSRASTAPSLGTGTGSLTGSMWGDVPDALTRYKTAASLWELDFDEIEIIRKIGEGSFGEVLLGNFRGTKVGQRGGVGDVWEGGRACRCRRRRRCVDRACAAPATHERSRAAPVDWALQPGVLRSVWTARAGAGLRGLARPPLTTPRPSFSPAPATSCQVAVKRLHPLDGDGSSCGSGSGAPGSGAAPGASLAAFKQFFEREIAILASIRHPNVRPTLHRRPAMQGGPPASAPPRPRGGAGPSWHPARRAARLTRSQGHSPSSIHSPHPDQVVNFIGACHRASTRCLVTEYCARGSLDKLLHKSGLALDLTKRIEFALDVARGMACLHAQQPIIIHRDLKTANLLVSARFEVKVADFGLSRIKDATHVSGGAGAAAAGGRVRPGRVCTDYQAALEPGAAHRSGVNANCKAGA
jgi:serine/threonine protein kinase